MKFKALIISLLIVAVPSFAFAGNLGIGVHAGYGEVNYQEARTDGSVSSESEQNAVLLGLSAERSISDRYYAALVADWVLGAGDDDEAWTINGTQRAQTNQMKFTGEFYDVRLGLKGNFSKLYYRGYVSGGWDGIHFRRRQYVVGTTPSTSGPTTEDFSLWRAGGGVSLEYKLGKWGLNTNGSYGFYYQGTVTNSTVAGAEFDTNGSCMDLGAGISRELTDKMNLYVGTMYSNIELDEDVQSGSVFPESSTKMLFGVASLTIAF